MKVKITDKNGKECTLNIEESQNGKTLNDFILRALSISENKRKLPLIMGDPNGLEAYPEIKMKFEGYGSPLLGDKLEAMTITTEKQ